MANHPGRDHRQITITKHYNFTDYATQAYMALVALIVLVCHGGRLASWPWLLLAHGVGLLLVHVLIGLSVRYPTNRLLDFCRQLYPIPLYVGFYSEAGFLNQIFRSGYWDPHFMKAEHWIFGMQPGLELMLRFPSRWVAEVLYATYFSYYLTIVGMGLALLLRNRREFAHFIAVVSLVFYVCYTIYIFTPVIGPRIVDLRLADAVLPRESMPETNLDPPATVQSAIFYKVMNWIYDHFETPGAAFPSSHVAVALCTLYFSFIYLRPVRWIHLIVVVVLCVSTVYGRYHYVMDVVAGILAAAMLIPLANRLYFKFENAGRP